MNAISVPHLTIESMEDATIDADAFDHEAHIYIA